MEASVIESPKQIKIIETSLPEIGNEEVLVKLNGTGLCVSNLPVWEGRPWFEYPAEPGAPGHEGYGTVEKTGDDVSSLSPGDKVALLSYHAYAEYDKAHVSNVVKLPDTVNGAPFPGEPLACAVNIFKRCDIQKNQTVVVIGTGFIGSLLIQLLKDSGAAVIAVSRRDSSLEFAKKSGADHLVKFEDIHDTAKNITQLATHGVPRIIEATGAQQSLDLATEIISEYGRLIIAGFHQDGLRKINMQIWNWKGIDVINAHERNPQVYIEGLKEAIIITNRGVLRPQELISHQFDFKEIGSAFKMLHEKPEGFLKGLIVYS
ncbi:MAG: MDR/zinc-dependent alcohol dehydrogenase-like family protein [Prolixibacteraceae bacterium]